MNAVSLSTIAQWSGGRLLAGSPDVLVTRVSTDSRALQQGDFFVAIRGENFDGHQFITTAQESGAAGAMVEKAPLGLPSQFGLVEVLDTLKGIQRLATAYRETLSLKVVAITGSNGKTSTKDLTAAVLGQRFATSKTQGNLNNHLGVPLTLLSISGREQAAVVEMGMNHPGEIAPLAAMAKPDVAIITNIGVAHIEYMGSREAIALEKGTLAEAIGESGTVVLNADDDMTPGIAARCRSRVITAGIVAGDVRAAEVRATEDGMEFVLSHGGESVPASIPVLGEHMVRNATLAVAAGLAVGLTLDECATGLASLKLSKGRLQRKAIRGVAVLDDTYNANPDSMVAGMATLAGYPGAGRRIAVLGRMGELGTEAENGHRRVGVAAANIGIDLLITVGEEPRWIADSARSSGLAQVVEVADTAAAAVELRKHARTGDVVLVKGSRSARMERVIEAFEKEEQV